VKPGWLGTLIEELRKDDQFTSDDLLDAFWLARWTAGAKWALPLGAPHEVAVASQPAAEKAPTTVAVPPLDSGHAPPARTKSTAPLPPGEVDIYSPTPHAAQPDATKASPIRLPGTFALPRALEFGRALRPFKQYRASHTRSTLDVGATIVFFERHRQLIPQLRPEPERWFDIALVTDDAPSMAVWRKTFSELERLLSTHGAFRRVRRFTLAECLKGAEAKRDPLQDPERRTLILFLSDGASAVWHRKDLIDCMRKWAATAPMGIVQMFPAYHWPATSLGRATRDMRAPAPGVPNQQLTVSTTWRGGLPPEAVAVPITTLDPLALGEWAKMVMAKRGTWNAAVVLHPGSRRTKRTEDLPSPQRQVENFRKTASPAAFDLACYLSTVPLCLPVMRVLMEAMIPRPRLSYLAEILASGLLRAVESEPGTDPELVQYGFDPQVADLLRAQVRLQEAAQAQEAVQQEIRKFVEKLAGRRLPSDVFLVPDEVGKSKLPESAEAFLRVKHELAERLRPRVQQPMGALRGVPELPTPFLERPQALEGLIDRILSATSSFALGGPGRKVMAAAAVRDVRIRRAFSRGIYWDAPAINTPSAARSLFVAAEYPKPLRAPPVGAIVLSLQRRSIDQETYDLPPVSRQEADLYFTTLGLTGQQASDLEKFHQFNPDRCLVLARALRVFGTDAVLKLAATWNDQGHEHDDPLRKAVLDSLFPYEARQVVYAMSTFFPGAAVPGDLVESVILSRFDRGLVTQAWATAVQMDFCEGPDASEFPPLREALVYDLSRDTAPLDSQVADYYFSFFDACWDSVRTDRYLFWNLIPHLVRLHDFRRIEQVLLDPYWYAYKASLFGFEAFRRDGITISDFKELFAFKRLLDKARDEFDSLAPEVIAEGLVKLVANEPEIAQLTAVVEQNLRRGFPQTQPRPAQWILVAGTGIGELPPQVVKLSERLGETLAARRLNLVGGGWPGVDHVVGRAFATAVEETEDKVDSRFLQMVPPGKRPDLQAGQIVTTKNEFGELVSRADAVVLIGGTGGTYGCFRTARKQSKPVYPLPTTGGDAKRAFDEFFSFPTEAGLSARRMRMLEVEIEDDSSIDILLNRLMALIGREDREGEWAQAVLKLILDLSALRDGVIYHSVGDYLAELAVSAEVVTEQRSLQYFARHTPQADSSVSFAVERLRNCLPAASIWLSFDILGISALVDIDKWDKGPVIQVLIPLLLEFCPEEAESTLAATARFEPSASPTPNQWLEAAERLRKRYDSSLAERFYRKALRLSSDHQMWFDACAGLGHIRILRGELGGAKEIFEQALKAAGSDARSRSIALHQLGKIQRTLGDFQAAEKLYREALEVLSNVSVNDTLVAVTTDLGIIYRHVDTLQRAEAQHRSALAMSEGLGDPGLTAQVLNNLASVFRLRGELNPAEDMNRRALALYEGIGARQGVAESYAGIGLVCRVRGNLPEAEKNARLALDINRAIGRRLGMADNYDELGSVYRATGDLDEAQKLHELALAVNRDAGRQPGIADSYDSLGLVSSLRGDLPGAIHWYRQALSINESVGREWGIADTLVNLSAAYRRRRSLDEAQSYCERALGINEKIGRVPAIARTLTNFGQIWYARRQWGKAEEYFRRALHLDEQIGRLGGIAENKYHLGRIAARRGDASGGRTLMLEALEKYQAGGFRRRVESIQRELGASDATAF
jgi:tetratricopeptide (TPR) repeat protein